MNGKLNGPDAGTSEQPEKTVNDLDSARVLFSETIGAPIVLVLRAPDDLELSWFAENDELETEEVPSTNGHYDFVLVGFPSAGAKPSSEWVKK